jgi:beta-carotene 3-hydroxylase
MLHLLFISVTVLLSFLGMEGVAWLTHKYLMHGWLWSLHRDHHRKEGPGYLETNDLFFLIFAIPGMILLALGTLMPKTLLTSIGAGITLYGACYFLVHDLFIHQRIKLLRNSDHWYLKAIRRAHKMHHKHLDKEDGECFGMLWVPFRYFRETRKDRTT